MTAPDPDVEQLLSLAQQGDADAQNHLLMQHRDRLRRMVAVRMDPMLKPRVDPSDVVQETLLEASRKLPDYLRERPLPLYPWLRQIAWQRLVHLHDQHIAAQRRSVNREARTEMLSDESAMELADRFVTEGTSPSRQAIRHEMQRRVRTCLNRLPPNDSEVLVMWYLEQLSIAEIAAILGVSESGIKSRHRRAMLRFGQVLSGDGWEN